MKGIVYLHIFLALAINLTATSAVSAKYKIKDTQIRGLPGTEMMKIETDNHYIRGMVTMVHIQAKKRLLERDSAVSIYCTLSKDGKKFGTLTFNDKIERDGGASYLVNRPFSPWIPYHGGDITVTFEIIEITRKDNLKGIVSTLSDQINRYVSFVPKAAIVGIAFDAVKPIINKIIELRKIANRTILKAERTFYVPEITIMGVLSLKYQHYIVFDNKEKGPNDSTIYEYIKENCELDSDGYLQDKTTRDLYRGTSYIIFRFEPVRYLYHDTAKLTDRDDCVLFKVGENFAKLKNWAAVDQVGLELNRSVCEDKNLLSTDRAFILTKFLKTMLICDYPKENPKWLSPRYFEILLAKHPDVIGKEKDLFLSSLEDTSKLVSTIDVGIHGHNFSSIVKKYNIDVMDPASISSNRWQLYMSGVNPDKLIEFSQKLQVLSETRPIMSILEVDPSYWITLSREMGIDFHKIYRPQE